MQDESDDERPADDERFADERPADDERVADYERPADDERVADEQVTAPPRSRLLRPSLSDDLLRPSNSLRPRLYNIRQGHTKTAS